MTPRPVRVAVVGCGSIGPAHARGYQAAGQAVRVACADVVGERAEAFAATYGFGRAHRSLTELLAAEPVDLVSIATPPGTHAELCLEALEAGVAVLVEKPSLPTLAELDAVEAAAERLGGTVYGVFQHRHGTGARRAKALVESGAAGRPQVAVCDTLWFRPDGYFDLDWRGTWAGEGGGPTLGHAIHQIDLMLHLVGPWRTVSALAARVARPVEFEDVSSAAVVFENGAVGSIISSLLSPREVSRVRVDLTGGTLEVNHVYGYRDADWTFQPTPGAAAARALGRNPGLVADPAEPVDDSDDVTEAVWTGTAGRFGAEVPSNHVAQLVRLVDDLAHGRPHETTLASTRPTMELVTAVYASALTGEPVHRRDLVPGHPFYADLRGGLGQAAVDGRLTCRA